MACKKQTVPFMGTPEQEAALKSAIAELGDQPGALMPVMQKAQEVQDICLSRYRMLRKRFR